MAPGASPLCARLGQRGLQPREATRARESNNGIIGLDHNFDSSRPLVRAANPPYLAERPGWTFARHDTHRRRITARKKEPNLPGDPAPPLLIPMPPWQLRRRLLLLDRSFRRLGLGRRGFRGRGLHGRGGFRRRGLLLRGLATGRRSAASLRATGSRTAGSRTTSPRTASPRRARGRCTRGRRTRGGGARDRCTRRRCTRGRSARHRRARFGNARGRSTRHRNTRPGTAGPRTARKTGIRRLCDAQHHKHRCSANCQDTIHADILP
jgi:hypothetical protein